MLRAKSTAWRRCEISRNVHSLLLHEACAGIRLCVGMNDERAATRNIVLRELSPKDYEKITSVAECVTLATKEQIWQANQPIQNVYFPETAVISLVTLLDAGSIEAITIGNDGFVGLPIFHGPGSTVTQPNCQMPRESWRLGAAAFIKLGGELPELRRALDRYSQLVIETISQSAACNRVHVIEERCARWLLMSHD